MKQDDLSGEHLEWLVKSRGRVQRASAKLYRLLVEHEAVMKKDSNARLAHKLVEPCFALWRAAFLADKTGKKGRVYEDAKLFLGKMLIDNAITYPQDRAAREWSFNFYVAAAEGALQLAIERWPDLEVGFRTAGNSKMTYAKKRWHRCQTTLEGALKCLSKDLRR